MRAAALAIAVALPLGAQVQAGGKGGSTVVTAAANPEANATKKLEFDAASVRPSTQAFVLKGTDFLDPVGDKAPPLGGLFSWNVQLSWLINFAFDLRSSQERRGAREALPKWAQDDWYTVEARVEGNPTRDDVRQMVRSLLEDRFQLTGHLEKREGQVYALVVEKPGLGLKPHPEGAPCTLSQSQIDENRYTHVYPWYKASPAQCGVSNRQLGQAAYERRIEMLDVTMQQVADSLGLGLPLSVLDKTGLKGRYDAVLDVGYGGVQPDADPSDDLGLLPLPIALEKQLGLKLVKQNAPVDVFVIDHIAVLSEN